MEQALTITQKEEVGGIVSMIKTVESIIKKSNVHLTERQLLRRLSLMTRKRVNSSALKLVLDLLKDQDKIIQDSKTGAIIWTAADNPYLHKLVNESISLR